MQTLKLLIFLTMVLTAFFIILIAGKNKIFWSRLSEKGKKAQKTFLAVFYLLFITEIIIYFFVSLL